MSAMKKLKLFAVDVHWDVARSFEVDATSREEAEELIWKRINTGGVDVWKDGFEATDDVEVECHGVENADGEIEYD